MAACAGRGGTAAKAEDQPSTEGERPRLFTLDRLDAYLELESHVDQDRVRYENRLGLGGSTQQTNRDWHVEERLGFKLAGAVIDPGLISFQGDFSFGLTQDHFYEDSPFRKQSDSDTGSLLDYDFRVNLLQGKPLSGSFYGLRVDDRIARRFQPTLDERRTGFGTSWFFAHERFPMELTYDYLKTDRTGNRDRIDNEYYTDSALHYGAQWLISDHHRLKMSFEHADNKQEYQGSLRPFETIRDLWVFEHEIDFGLEHQHDLHTLVHWQEESGDFARDLFEFGPQLTLRHSDTFQTLYKYQFTHEDYEQMKVDQHRGELQFVHQLFSNLTTTGTAFGLYEKVDEDIETNQYGASMDWQYNRSNPYGHFFANLALAFDNEHTGGDNGMRLVLNESATFHDPLAITLRNRNVAPYTIVVTDSSNRRFYRPGIDYIVVRLGQWTRLARIRSGRIVDDETVLIDYEYNTPADGETDTVRADFSAEQRFKGGLTPYYLFDYRNQEVSQSVGFPMSADRTDHHRVGLKFERDRYYLGAEYEVYDDTIEPYDAYHLDGRYTLWHTPQHSLDGSTRLSRFLFDGDVDDRNTTLLDLDLDHRWLINDSLSCGNRAAYRWQSDSVEGNTNAVDLSSVLSYALGDLSLELSVEYDLLDLPVSKEDGFSVWLNVRRDFIDLLARR